jgi:predicted dehydrogenase
LRTPGIAVLGSGYWGRNLVRNFHELGALRFVCDASEAARAQAASIAPGVEVGSDAEAVLNRIDVDALAIATPAETHCPLTLQALAAGKDVFVEKPLAMTHGQGIAMREEAERRGRILMVGHLLEYHPAVRRLRALIAEGVLGRINYIYSNRLNFGRIRTEENALWSFAPHDIAVILRIVGELPVQVTCSGGSYVTRNLADVTVSGLQFASGVRAHIFVSWLNPFKEQKLVVVGDRKMAVFNDVTAEEKLVLYDQRVDLANHQPVLQRGERTVVEVGAEEPLRNECAHFLECVRTRRRPWTDAASGIDVLRVLEACQASLQGNGRPVVLSELEKERAERPRADLLEGGRVR